jgi:TetR/AcrR family transcriptional regulator, transcriptional repressor for nem operon
MKVSREQAAANREHILDVATASFRERGFDGIGVADLMRAAGLTHGGFYGHFASKEDLIAQASARGVARSVTRWQQLAQRCPDNPLAAIAANYLSPRHCGDPGSGCTLAALGSDLARQPVSVRHGVTDGLRASFALLAGIVSGKSKAAKRDRAMATYASLVGGILLARAVDDPQLAKRILRAVAASVAAPVTGD